MAQQYNHELTCYQASKVLGSECPEALRKVNIKLFDIVYRMAVGKLSSENLIAELVSVLENEEVARVTAQFSNYFYPQGTGFPCSASLSA